MTSRKEMWLKLTGLLPPEERGFTPALEGDELSYEVMLLIQRRREEAEIVNKKLDKIIERSNLSKLSRLPRQRGDAPYPMRPKWALPSRSVGDTSPSWDNVVRAYEEV